MVIPTADKKNDVLMQASKMALMTESCVETKECNKLTKTAGDSGVSSKLVCGAM